MQHYPKSISNRIPVLNNAPSVFYVLCFVFGLSIIVLRAIKVGITHDEAISYGLIDGNYAWVFTANNHWLSTVLSYISHLFFGNQPWALRFPNIMAYGLYSYFAYKILRSLEGKLWVFLLCSAFLLLNPYTNEYFSLFRGYGLALAFFTASLYHFMQYGLCKKNRHLHLFFVFALLCIYANYAFVIALISLMACLIGWKTTRVSVLKKNLKSSLLFLLFLMPTPFNIWVIKTNQHLSFGGDDNVFSDTLFSVFSSVFLFQNPVMAIFCCIAIGSLILWGLMRRHKNILIRPISIAMAFMLIIPELLHWFLGIKFPLDRAGMYWIPLLMVQMAVFLNEEYSHKIANITLTIGMLCISLLGVAYYFINLNIKYLHENKLEADIPQMLNALEKQIDQNHQYSLGIDWFFEPSINYYRNIRQYHWLKEVDRSVNLKNKNFYYIVNTTLVKDNCTDTLESYTISQTTLLKSCNN